MDEKLAWSPTLHDMDFSFFYFDTDEEDSMLEGCDHTKSISICPRYSL